MQIGFFDIERDRRSVLRMWQEVGWLDRSSEKDCKAFDHFVQAGPGMVARQDGEAECLALSAAGTLRYLQSEVRLAGITGVTTSLIGRQHGLASTVTARLVAHCAQQGAQVAMLGIFDQGYYDRLGFGTGAYCHRLYVSPEHLTVPLPDRSVCRFTVDDWEELHRCRVERTTRHGFVTFDSEEIMRGEMLWSKNGGGLGFRDADGRVTHFLWYQADDLESGPFRLPALCYSNYGQFIELLGIIRSLKDQVRLVSFSEPPGIQLQDLLDRPFRNHAKTTGSKYANRMEAYAASQVRICDLPGCVSAVRLTCEPVRFNLRLSDPIEQFLDDDQAWRGIAGDYIITLGPESTAEVGSADDLPTLTASVGAFTRLWLGVQPATGLAATDSLAGPEDLLQTLDDAIRLPTPRWDWMF